VRARASDLAGILYSFAEMWVDLNENKQPKNVPSLPVWGASKSQASATQPNATARLDQRARSSSAVAKGPLDASVTTKIEGHRQELGQALYQSILTMVAQVRSARDIPNQQLQTKRTELGGERHTGNGSSTKDCSRDP